MSDSGSDCTVAKTGFVENIIKSVIILGETGVPNIPARHRHEHTKRTQRDPLPLWSLPIRKRYY